VSNREALQRAMPALLAHEGVWTGRYRSVDLDGRTVDEHASRVECVFPGDGPWHYLQRNRFEWADGRVRESEFGGRLAGERLVWDVDTFSGRAWTTDAGIVLLELERKDQPDTRFTEIIVLGDDGASRARSWHWFRNGTFFQRTLCDEVRGASSGSG